MPKRLSKCSIRMESRIKMKQTTATAHVGVVSSVLSKVAATSSSAMSISLSLSLSLQFGIVFVMVSIKKKNNNNNK